MVFTSFQVLCRKKRLGSTPIHHPFDEVTFYCKMEPPLKRKKGQETAPAASTSTQTIKKPLADLSWSSILTGIHGQRGEPGAIEGERAGQNVIAGSWKFAGGSELDM
jgi:hypothetical protein